MGLVDYDETDVEDERGSNKRVRRSSTSTGKGGHQGGNMFFQSQKKGSTTTPPVLNRPLKSARPRVIQQTNICASPVVSHGFDPTDRMFLKSQPTWQRTPGAVNASEMNEGGVRRKAMSTKLAMQNEIVCKRKEEGLQKQARNDVPEPSRTVQGVSPNVRTVGIKRPAPPTNLSYLPPQHAIQLYSQQAPQSQPVLQFCKECNVMCSGSLNLQMHYRGKKHKAKVEELRIQKDGVVIGNGFLECSLCKIPCMNERNLQEHLAGKKHAACLQAINGAFKGKGAEVQLWSGNI